MSENTYTRRSFVAGTAGIAAAGLVAGTVTGGKAALAEPVGMQIGSIPAADVPTCDETYETDVVVCGSGTAGMSAAWRSRELGASVIVVEALSEDGVGGNSRYVEGMSSGGCSYTDGVLTPGTDQELLDHGYSIIDDFQHGGSNLPILRKFVQNFGPMLEWTHDDMGIQFKGIDIPQNSTQMAPPISYAPSDDGLLNGGLNVIYTMYQGLLDMGVEFHFDSRAVQLVVNEDGSMGGVVCQHLDGSLMLVRAKAVMLGTGGFAANKEMFERFTNYDYDALIPYGTSGTQRGDAITMGESVGAALHHPEAVMFCSPVLPGHFNKSALVLCGCNQADTIFLNEKGRRFCNEECIRDWAISGNAGAQQKHIYVVVDDDYVEKICTQGAVTKRTNYLEPGIPVPEFRDEIETALARENPRVFKADTLEELAADLDVDPDAMEATIEQWNGWCDGGKDEDFLKSADNMRKVRTPPFYGFKTMLAFYTTVGGLRVDEFARVVDKRGHDPIPGLYALGCDAGGLFGGTYDVTTCPGSNQMWDRQTGYYAGTHAVEEYFPSLT